MRIAVIHLGRRGFSGPFSHEIATRLAQQAEVLAVLSHHSESLAVWENSNMALIVTPTYLNIVQAAWTYISRSQIRRLAAQIRAWGPDVLIYTMFYTWNPFVHYYLQDIPSVVAVHDPIPHPGITSKVYWWLEDRLIRQSDQFVIFSQAFVKDLEQRGIKSDQISVCPFGDLSYYLRINQSQPQTPPSKTTLLFFGRITAYKGVEILLKAYREVVKRYPVRLLLVGNGSLRPYRSLMKDLPDMEIVNRWVSEEEIPDFFRQASIVIIPYTSATQSGVPAITAGFGLPIIATRVGGLPEQIRDGETGLLIEPGRPEALVTAIERLIENPNLAARLGRNLRQEYSSNENWDILAQTFYEAAQKAILTAH
jgi:glycosyltransferase involved in cell wall biosynthesis